MWINNVPSVITCLFLLPCVSCATLDKTFYKRENKSGLCNDESVVTNGCVTVVPSNCSEIEIQRWEDAPFCNFKQSCGLYLPAYENVIHESGATRNAVNITSISRPRSEFIWLMYEDRKKPEEPKCFTLKVSLSLPTCADISAVFFDCHIKDFTGRSLMNTGSITTIRSLVNDQKNLYIFKNLYDYDLTNGKIFFYIQNQEGPINLTFQKYGEKINYLIKLCLTEQNRCIEEKIVNLNDRFTFIDRFDDLIRVQIGNNKLKNGSYYVNVSSCNDERCNLVNYNLSRTYEFSIQEIENHVLVTTSTIVIVLIVIFCAFALSIFYQRRKILKPISKQLTMLLACDAATIQHANYAKTLQLFLTHNLGIKVLLDIIEIPASQGKSPYTWYTTIFEQVDFVAVIVPPKAVFGIQRGSPYEKKTLQLCLNLIENRKMAASPSAIKNCFFLFVPDSGPSLLQNELNFLSKFEMPLQYLSLRQHIQFVANGNSHYNAFQHFNLPLCCFPKQNTLSTSFFDIFNRISRDCVETPLLSPMIRSEEVTPLIDENCADYVIQQNTDQLDSAFGRQVPSVRTLSTITNIR